MNIRGMNHILRSSYLEINLCVTDVPVELENSLMIDIIKILKITYLICFIKKKWLLGFKSRFLILLYQVYFYVFIFLIFLYYIKFSDMRFICNIFASKEKQILYIYFVVILAAQKFMFPRMVYVCISVFTSKQELVKSRGNRRASRRDDQSNTHMHLFFYIEARTHARRAA